MPLRLLFVVLAAVALLGCAARPAVCKLPPHVADLTIESPMDGDFDVDMSSVVVESETQVIASYIIVPAWSACSSSSIPSTVALAGHQESGP